MKLLFYSNAIIYITILSCYISVIYTVYGLIAQFIFGIFQLIVGFYLLTVCYNFNQKVRTFIKYYWTSIVIYIPILIGLLLLISNNVIQSNSKALAVLMIIVAPMLIATYLIFILYNIQKS